MGVLQALPRTSRVPSRVHPVISTTLNRRYSTVHVKEEQDDVELPNGFLFNEKPLLPGEKRKKEAWENIYVFGMVGNLILAFVLLYYQPDTDIATWARIQAQKRLQAKEQSKSDDA